MANRVSSKSESYVAELRSVGQKIKVSSDFLSRNVNYIEFSEQADVHFRCGHVFKAGCVSYLFVEPNDENFECPECYPANNEPGAESGGNCTVSINPVGRLPDTILAASYNDLQESPAPARIVSIASSDELSDSLSGTPQTPQVVSNLVARRLNQSERVQPQTISTSNHKPTEIQKNWVGPVFDAADF